MFEGLFQPTHLIVIFGIALPIFGPRKLPELAKESAKASADSSAQWRMKAPTTGRDSHSRLSPSVYTRRQITAKPN